MQNSGIDNIIKSFPRLLGGIGETVKISVIALVLSVILGLIIGVLIRANISATSAMCLFKKLKRSSPMVINNHRGRSNQ